MADLNNKRLLNISEAVYYTGLGKTKCREFLESIGAFVHVGSRVFADKNKIDKALDTGDKFCTNLDVKESV